MAVFCTCSSRVDVRPHCSRCQHSLPPCCQLILQSPDSAHLVCSVARWQPVGLFWFLALTAKAAVNIHVDAVWAPALTPLG